MDRRKWTVFGIALGAGLIVVVAAANPFSGIAIGSGSVVGDVISFYPNLGAVYFANNGAVAAHSQLEVNASHLHLMSGDETGIHAAGDLSAGAIGDVDLISKSAFTAYGQDSLVAFSFPDDCEELTPACVEAMLAFYMGALDEYTPEDLTEVSLRAGYGDLSVASMDGAFRNRAALHILASGDARLQGDIASDEGDRATDPRASVTCTRAGDVVIQLGGPGAQSESMSAISGGFSSQSLSSSEAAWAPAQAVHQSLQKLDAALSSMQAVGDLGTDQ